MNKKVDLFWTSAHIEATLTFNKSLLCTKKQPTASSNGLKQKKRRHICILMRAPILLLT